MQSAVVTRWPEIVGEQLAAVAKSIRFPAGKKEGGNLTLTVRGAHAAMMGHVTPEIMERVNRFFGYAAVARVTIRQGEVARPRRAPSRSRPPGRTRREPEDDRRSRVEGRAGGAAPPVSPPGSHPSTLPKVR
ncbi:DciA family protein [Sphingomonas sp. MMS24-JH45]